MFVTVMKVIVSALIITGVTAISKTYPELGGWIAALPVISILSAIWLVAGHQPLAEVSRFLVGVLKGLIPTAILLTTVVVFLRRGWPFTGALSIAMVIWGVSSLVVEKAWPKV